MYYDSSPIASFLKVQTPTTSWWEVLFCLAMIGFIVLMAQTNNVPRHHPAEREQPHDAQQASVAALAGKEGTSHAQSLGRDKGKRSVSEAEDLEAKKRKEVTQKEHK